MREPQRKRNFRPKDLFLAALALLFISWQTAGAAHDVDIDAHSPGTTCHICHAHDRTDAPPSVLVVFSLLVTQNERAVGMSTVAHADVSRPVPCARGPPHVFTYSAGTSEPL